LKGCIFDNRSVTKSKSLSLVINVYKLGLVLVFSNRLVDAYNLLLQLTWMHDLRELIARTP